MPSGNRWIRQRQAWVERYRSTGDAGLVCRRCGISRPTLRKWWRRYQARGEAGLRDRSRRPQVFGRPAVSLEQIKKILELRKGRRLGPKRLQAELLRLYKLRLSTSTIWKILHRHGCPPLRRRRRPSQPRRYSRPLPGDRVQLDTFKVANGLIQYTAVDDCTRLRVLGLYSGRTVKNAVHFLEERVIPDFPFPIQRVQTDRGGEFFGLAFQRALRRNAIKFRPIRPRSPHLKGICERFQKTVLNEFYRVMFRKKLYHSLEELQADLDAWLKEYNERRPHQGRWCYGKTPMQTFLDSLPLAKEKMIAA